MDPDLWQAEVSRGAWLVKSTGVYSSTTHRESYVGAIRGRIVDRVTLCSTDLLYNNKVNRRRWRKWPFL